MLNNQGLKYDTELLNTKLIIKKIKALGINIDNLEKTLNQIETKVVEQINQLDEQYKNQLNHTFKEDFLCNIYTPALEQLTNLQTYLIEEYDSYIQIDKKYDYLKDNIENITKDNFDTYQEMLEELLNLIKDSPKLAFLIQGEFVQKIYRLVYQLVKIELSLFKQDTLLDQMKHDVIGSCYLNVCIQEELSKIELSKHKKLALKVKEIETDGLETDYLDKELLIILSSLSMNKPQEDSINDKEEESQSHLILQQELEAITDKENECQKKIKDLEKQYSNYHDQNLNKKKEILFWVSIMLGEGINGIMGMYNADHIKKYYTIEQTYQEGKPPKNIPPYYEEEDEDSIIVTYYHPYKEKTPSLELSAQNKEVEFIREIETYDVSNIECEKLADYLELDLEFSHIEPEISFEPKTHLTPADTYQETYAIVRKKSHDLTKYKIESDPKEKKHVLLLNLSLELLILFHILDIKPKKLKKEYQTKMQLLEQKEQLEEIRVLKKELDKNPEEYTISSAISPKIKTLKKSEKRIKN